LAHHRIAEAIDLVEDAQRRVDGQGLAQRPAQIGLERVAEAAIGVLVGAQRREHGLGRAALEQVQIAPAVDQPGIGPDEGLGGGAVGLSRHSVLPH
jgi:hypothetical protein